MPLTREERKLLHQKSKEPTFGSGKPDSSQGLEGDLSYRKISGSGTVQYIKQSHEWVPMSSSGTMPPLRIGSGGGGGSSSGASGGISSHTLLHDLDVDTHLQYLLIDGTRAMTSVVTIGADSDGTDRSITWGHSTLKTIMGIDDSSDAFVINTDAAFDATLANNSFSIDANHNVIIAGDVSVGDDLFLTSSGSIINWHSGDVTLTHATGKLTFGGDGTVELDFNNHEMTNVDIDSGAIDGTAIGAASHSTIKGTTIDATTDFTIDGLIITADTISNDANLTIDVAADIILDAAGKDISLTDGSGTAEFIFNLEAAPELDVDGAFTIDGSSTIRLDSVGNMDFYVNGREKLKFDTNGHAYFHAYAQTLFNDYPININVSNSHLTSGEADFQQNYSWLGEHSVSSAYNTDFGT